MEETNANETVAGMSSRMDIPNCLAVMMMCSKKNTPRKYLSICREIGRDNIMEQLEVSKAKRELQQRKPSLIAANDQPNLQLTTLGPSQSWTLPPDPSSWLVDFTQSTLTEQRRSGRVGIDYDDAS